MNSTADHPASPTHGKRLLHGVLLWASAFVLYLVPGFVVAFRMAADLGPKLKDSTKVAQQIGPAVSALYAESVPLRIAFLVLLAAMIVSVFRSVVRRLKKR